MSTTEVDFQQFRQWVRDALGHLYNPAFQSPADLSTALGYADPQEQATVRALLLQSIQQLEPSPDVPESALIRRLHHLLHLRYVRHCTQEETAERLSVTPRHLRRLQQQAIYVLAERLLEQQVGVRSQPAGPDTLPASADSPVVLAADSSTDWQSQVRHELALLRESVAEESANVASEVQGVIRLMQALSARRQIRLMVGELSPSLAVAVHPSVLREILVTAVEKLAPLCPRGEIAFSARRLAASTQIMVAGCPAHSAPLPDSEFLREILAAYDGSVELRHSDRRLAYDIRLPFRGTVNVLVVDDNADLVHFYRRYTAGTPYHIVHLPEGRHVIEAVERMHPEIIVLDIMLPDVDGWELLANLREHPSSRSIPIIVCSVVRRGELALALGASLCLAKPVRHSEFIEALNRVLSSAPG